MLKAFETGIPLTVPHGYASETMVPVPMADLFTIAAQYERSGRMPEANRLLNYILAVAPNQPDTLHMSGIVAFRLGRLREAVEKMEKAIEFGVEIALYLRNVCEVYRTLRTVSTMPWRRHVGQRPSRPAIRFASTISRFPL